MRIRFKTRLGAVYELDYDASKFRQSKPIVREGPLFNSSPVLIGHQVFMWTKAPEGSTALIKCIQTGSVVSREVIFAEYIAQSPEVV